MKPNIAAIEKEIDPDGMTEEIEHSIQVPLPSYLQQTYWWAYLHPMAVRIFERQWLVNLILFGNFARLRDHTLDELGSSIYGNVLQIACVYGNFTELLLQRLDDQAQLSVVDVAEVQLENLRSKLMDTSRVVLYHQDSTDLKFPDAHFDSVVLFFLLHEQPKRVRIETIAQAMRVAKPGGTVICVDYHKPSLINPFRYLMIPILTTLEPFAMDLWRQDIIDWLPDIIRNTATLEKKTYFGGLYQKVVIKKSD
jgi:ubiquinone/menaquinone biosynthesis C-methylase UbiE